MKTVEEFANSVANKINPQPENPQAQVSPAMIEMIMQLIISMIGGCPKPADIAKTIKKPTLRQRAFFRSQVMDSCSICFRAQFRQQAGAITEEMITQAKELSDGDIASIAFDATNPDFVVI